MLSRFFESLYTKVFINITLKSTVTDVYIEVFSKKGTLRTQSMSFDTTRLREDMVEFISSYIKESPYYYVSFLDASLEQGAIPTCERNRLSYYYDVSASEHKCYEKKWTYYTAKTDLYEREKIYAKIGVDFIFSPFSLLSYFFKDKIDTDIAIYLLMQENSISLSVFKHSQLLYAEHLEIELESESNEILLSQDLEEEEEEGIELDDLDIMDELQELEDLEDFGDIEDLDTIEEIDEFSSHKDIEEEFYEAQEPVSESTTESFSQEFQVFSRIQESISSYYSDERYESSFVENIYIADATGSHADLKRYLEDEMYLNVYIRHIELGITLSDLAKEELGI